MWKRNVLRVPRAGKFKLIALALGEGHLAASPRGKKEPAAGLHLPSSSGKAGSAILGAPPSCPHLMFPSTHDFADEASSA